MFTFDRYPNRPEKIIWSNQRINAIQNKPQRELRKLEKKVPLLAPVLANDIQHVNVELAKKKLQLNSDNFIARMRHHRAVGWITARQLFRNLPKDVQEKVLKRWNNNRFRPKNPVNLLTIIDIESGEQAQRLKRINDEYAKLQRENSAEQLSLWS